MENEYFNTELCKRFVNDNNLPIPVLSDKDKFFYFVDLHEEMYGSRTLYNNLCDEINTDFNGDSEAFLQHFYEVRDTMINDILDNPKYQDFLSFDMNKYAVCDALKNIPTGNVYNGDNIGKLFLSIDLKKANFQALRFFDKSLVKGEDTFDDYLNHYTKSKYIHHSKYTRQVVFGKCNPRRQITLEKYLMSRFYEDFNYDPTILKLVRFNNDELVFELADYERLCEADKYAVINRTNVMVQRTSEKSGVEVSHKFYKLGAFCLHSEKTDKDRNTNYVLKYSDGTIEFKDVPQTYSAIITKLYRDLKPTKDDYYFRYEGLDAYIDDKFTLKLF